MSQVLTVDHKALGPLPRLELPAGSRRRAGIRSPCSLALHLPPAEMLSPWTPLRPPRSAQSPPGCLALLSPSPDTPPVLSPVPWPCLTLSHKLNGHLPSSGSLHCSGREAVPNLLSAVARTGLAHSRSSGHVCGMSGPRCVAGGPGMVGTLSSTALGPGSATF